MWSTSGKLEATAERNKIKRKVLVSNVKWRKRGSDTAISSSGQHRYKQPGSNKRKYGMRKRSVGSNGTSVMKGHRRKTNSAEERGREREFLQKKIAIFYSTWDWPVNLRISKGETPTVWDSNKSTHYS